MKIESSTELLEYLKERKIPYFFTGSRRWKLHKTTSDIDVVIPMENIDEIRKAMSSGLQCRDKSSCNLEFGWKAFTTDGGIIDILPQTPEEFNVWESATIAMTDFVKKFPLNNLGADKALRVKMFETFKSACRKIQ